MRLTSIILILCLSLILSAAALAQDAPPPAPASPEVVGTPNPPPPPDAAPAPDTATAPEPAATDEPAPAEPAAEPAPTPPPSPAPAVVAPATGPAAPVVLHRSAVMVGPKDSLGNPVKVTGQVTVAAKPSPGVKVANLEILVDGKTSIPVKSGSWAQFDSTTVSDGAHTLKAVGKDASGKQVWTATTKVEVNNGKPGKPTVTARAKPASGAKPALVKKPAPGSKPVKPAAAAVPGALTKVYTSTRHGFAVHYPAGWVTRDKTAAMDRRNRGNGWIAFTAPKKTDLVVNVRRRRLEAKSDADTFAKYNPYVSTWQRKTAMDAPAFATNTDMGNKIIHRLIVIKDGYVWMLNCVDGAGKTSDAGQKTFDSMAASLQLSVKPGPAAAKKPHIRRVRSVARVIKHHPAKPVAKPALKPAAKPIAKPVAKPALKPTAKPIAKPAVTPAVKPALKPAAKPTAKPAVKPAVKPTGVPALPKKP